MKLNCIALCLLGYILYFDLVGVFFHTNVKNIEEALNTSTVLFYFLFNYCKFCVIMCFV